MIKKTQIHARRPQKYTPKISDINMSGGYHKYWIFGVGSKNAPWNLDFVGVQGLSVRYDSPSPKFGPFFCVIKSWFIIYHEKKQFFCSEKLKRLKSLNGHNGIGGDLLLHRQSYQNIRLIFFLNFFILFSIFWKKYIFVTLVTGDTKSVLRTGWLEKKGEWTKKWGRRFLVLYTDGTLNGYKLGVIIEILELNLTSGSFLPFF